MKSEIAQVYELQTGKKFEFDYDEVKKRNNRFALNEMRDKLGKCGLGPLKIEENLAEYYFQSELQKRMNEKV